jgi:hypothetical protein
MVARDKKRLTGTAAVAGGVILLSGTVLLLGTASGEASGDVSVKVPGAVSISVFCGGEQTWHGDGDVITFVPDGQHCEIEAPLSAVMPLRGSLELNHAATYECGRVRMDLVCKPG